MIGVLGGGQLGRMLALAGYPLGCRFRFLDETPEAPVSGLGELVVRSFDDLSVVDAFVQGLSVATYEFEKVPVPLVQALEQRVPVYPSSAALEASQDRLVEKRLFRRLGIRTAPFEVVETRADLEAALVRTGCPALLKTRRFGYDGKGQFLLRHPGDVDMAWQTLGGVPLILEGFVAFERELSQITVRGRDGALAFYPLVENHHAEGILRLSLAPAPQLEPVLQQRAIEIATAVVRELNYVGVLTIELFQQGQELIANEMAPRVHNSGHWTIEGAQTSQFANHLRAILGYPLGVTAARMPCAMVNLIGTMPDVPRLLAVPGIQLHLYGKTPRPGRKIGHVTVVEPSEDLVRQRLETLRPLVEQRE
jgi:5-(carboxyamino)imidazole ribonucleotide synthase